MDNKVPSALRIWFIIHFVIDILFAIPLFFFPEDFLNLLQWDQIDPIASRIVAAALFAIGIESWLVRDSNPKTYINMLNLKIIWSGVVVTGISFTLYKTHFSATIFELLLLFIFLFFHIIWLYWRFRIKV